MPTDANAHTAILYEHPLLGEGIATYLRVAMGVQAVVASVSDVDAVQRAFALDPRVIIFERAGVLSGQDLGVLAPHAVMIDVTSVVCRGTPVEGMPVDFDRIVSAVRAGLDAA